MALGSGFSYRDWVALSTESTELTLSTGNTQLLPLINATTPRVKEISRLETIYFVSAWTVTYQLEMDVTGNGNQWDGLEGMTIGCVGLINHNLPLDAEVYVAIGLYDDTDTLMYSSGEELFSRQFENGSFYFLTDQVYTEVYRVLIIISVDDAVTIDEIDLGRLWIGNYLEADFDGNFGLLHGYAAKPKYSIGNDIHLRYKTPRKEMNFDFSLIDTAVVYGAGIDSWMDFSKWTSTNRDLVVLPNVADDDEKQYLGTYGILKRPMKLERLHGSYWSADFDIVELV